MKSCDFLIVGGGNAGCVLASRLKEYLPSASIILVEAGADEHENPLITNPLGAMALAETPLLWNYMTAPQEALGGKELYTSGGKVLSGSSSVNYGGWTRGDRADYDLWADLVGDKRWSYDGQLPYFRKTEAHYDKTLNPEQHGFEGPMKTTPPFARKYPLSKTVKEAYIRAGIEGNPDSNCGNNKGISPRMENWFQGKRQPAGQVYSLEGVNVITNTIVSRILFDENKQAIGAQFHDGSSIQANKEVIVSCGTFRSPHVLLLSGIGPKDELSKHSITPIANIEAVGKNLVDHFCLFQQFVLDEGPDRGLCFGSPQFNDPAFKTGIPGDHVIFSIVPSSKLEPSLQADRNPSTTHIEPARTHYEILPLYAPSEYTGTNLSIPKNGSIFATISINVLPTSRGTVTLASADAAADPIINPNYYSTQTDRTILREAIRKNMQAMETPEMAALIEREWVPEGYPALTSTSSDEEIDARVQRAGVPFWHSTGSCSMGQVVDTACRVLGGVKGLRVVDASVIPTPISAHYQVRVYALAEQAAEMIAGVHRG